MVKVNASSINRWSSIVTANVQSFISISCLPKFQHINYWHGQAGDQPNTMITDLLFPPSRQVQNYSKPCMHLWLRKYLIKRFNCQMFSLPFLGSNLTSTSCQPHMALQGKFWTNSEAIKLYTFQSSFFSSQQWKPKTSNYFITQSCDK